MKNLFRGSLFWLILYLSVMAVAALAYVKTRHVAKAFEISSATSSAIEAGEVSISISGEGLNQELNGHLVLDASNSHAIVGSIPFWEKIVDIEVVGDKAYLASKNKDIKIFDLNSPALPESNGVFGAKVDGWRIDADDRIIYVSAMKGGVSVFNRQTREKLEQIYLDGTAIKTVHRGKYLFIAGGYKGLSVFNVANPGSAKFVGQLSLPGITSDLTFYGEYLVIASQSGGLHLVDIEDPQSPTLLYTLKNKKSYTSVTVIDDFVYAFADGEQLDILEFTGKQLEILSSIPTFGVVKDYLRAGDNLYIAEADYGVSQLDISDPGHPIRQGYVGIIGEPSGLSLYEKYLYVASGSQGVQIIDTRKFLPRKVQAFIDTPGRSTDIELDGRWMFVADRDSALQVIDRSDPKNIQLVTHLATPSGILSLKRRQNVLFLMLERDGLLSVDIGNPLEPKIMQHFKIGNNFSDLAIKGTHLFVASSKDNKLFKIDISVPAQMKVVDSLDLPDSPRRLALSGDDVYIAAGRAGLLIARFAAGKPAKLIARMTRPWPMNEFAQVYGVAVRGNYAYVVHGEEGLQIVDIRRPDHPKEVGKVSFPGPSLYVRLSESYAIVSSLRRGFTFIDIRHPEKAYLAAHLYLPHATNFRVEADSLYVAGKANGVTVVPLPIRNLNQYSSSAPLLTFKAPLLVGWYDLNIGNGGNLKTVSAAVEVQ